MKQLLTFGSLSLLGTAAHYGVLAAWVELGHADPWWGSVVGATFGLLVNFALHSKITFAGTEAGITAFLRFALSAAGGFAVNAGVMAAGLALGWHWLAAQLAATAASFIANYALAKFWVFRPTESPQ